MNDLDGFDYCAQCSHVLEYTTFHSSEINGPGVNPMSNTWARWIIRRSLRRAGR